MTPEWVISERRDRGLCEVCGQREAVTIWAGTWEEICWECCENKREES